MEFNRLLSNLDYISEHHYFSDSNCINEFYDYERDFPDDNIEGETVNEFMSDLLYNRIFVNQEIISDTILDLVKLICNSEDLQEKFFEYGLKNLWKFIPIFEYAKTFYRLQQPDLSIFDIDIKLEKYRNTNLYFSCIMHRYPSYNILCDFIKNFNSDDEDTLNLISSVIYYCVSGKRNETYIKYEKLMRLGLTLKEALNKDLPETYIEISNDVNKGENVFASVYILPNILINIASYLDYNSILNLMLTCKFFLKSSCLTNLYKKTLLEYRDYYFLFQKFKFQPKKIYKKKRYKYYNSTKF